MTAQTGPGRTRRVTVVIPVLDDAEMLRHCLAALAAQTRRPDRILVVDNGSGDDSAQVARSAGCEVIDEPVRGILSATARGFDAAAADQSAADAVIVRLDADSRPDPDWLAGVMRYFESGEPPTAVTGTGRFYGRSPIAHRLGERLYLGGYFLWVRWLLGHPPLYGSNFAISAAAWREVGGGVHRDIRLIHDDLDLSFRLRPGMSVVFAPELSMPVSARPFATWSGALRRIWWGFRTIWINGKQQNLLRRRRQFRRGVNPGSQRR